MPRPYSARDALWILGALLLPACPLQAQEAEEAGGAATARVHEDSLAVLAGRVLHAESLRPVPDARVELADGGAADVTDRLGMFRFTGLDPGVDTLVVTALGGPSMRRPVRLDAGRTTRVEVTVAPDVIELEELEVTVEDDRVTSKIERLSERLDRNVGDLITRAQIDANAGRLSRAFRGVQAADVEYAGGGAFAVKLRSTFGRGSCDPQLFVNGFEAANLRVDDFVPVEVAAVEVYTADVLPADFMTPKARHCGAVVIWTRDFLGS